MSVTVDQIVNYWSSRKDEGDLGVDWVDAGERCWRCGYIAKLEKCHIVPSSLGGKLEARNLVLLCKLCHLEAPNVADESFLWRWIKSTFAPLYDTFWTLRAVEEFRRVFRREPFAGLRTDHDTVEQAKESIRRAFANTTWHWGEPRSNASTLAWVLRQAEEELLPPQANT